MFLQMVTGMIPQIWTTKRSLLTCTTKTNAILLTGENPQGICPGGFLSNTFTIYFNKATEDTFFYKRGS